MTHIKKLSPDTGSKRTSFPIYERKECKSLSCPRLSGKVSAKLTKGASVSRNGKVTAGVDCIWQMEFSGLEKN